MNKLYVNRGIKTIQEIQYNTNFLISFTLFDGINDAVKLIYKTIKRNKKIFIIGDFDVDGATSIALIILAVKKMGINNINYLVPSRFKEGYGLTKEIVKKAINHGAEFIITVDNGISSFSGIDYANKKGIPVIITDHHVSKKKLPNAAVIVNPSILQNMELMSLSGVGIALYLMIGLRNFLRKHDWFKKKQIKEPNLAVLLDLVALGTISDLVPLNYNNRILVFQGIQRIRLGKCRIGIKALLSLKNINEKDLTTQDISFFIAPMLNSAGRINDMSISVNLLLTNDVVIAKKTAKLLYKLNQIRKNIEQKMQNTALFICNNIKKNNKNILPQAITIYHSKWHQGIIGIIASKIKELLYRPVIVFASSKKNGILKGSGRSIPGIHILKILEYINDLYPNLILNFGGHEIAVGISLKEKNFKKFNEILLKSIKIFLKDVHLKKIVWTDGDLKKNEISLSTAELLIHSGPWGNFFPEPIFDGNFFLLQQNIVGKNNLQIIVRSIYGGPLLLGIVFNVDISLWPNYSLKKVKIIYKFSINKYSGKRILQLIVDYIYPI